MEAFEHLKNMSHDSIPMSLLEEKELDDYCQRLAIMDAKNERNIEIAKKMLHKGSEINFISECTGLSVDEINELKV